MCGTSRFTIRRPFTKAICCKWRHVPRDGRRLQMTESYRHVWNVHLPSDHATGDDVNRVNQSLTDDQDVVELLDTIDLRQELVDYGVVHARAAGARASLLADGIQFIKDDDVEAAVGSQLETDSKKEFSVAFFNETYHVKKNKKKLHRASLTLFCSSSASANSLRMLASDSPTYLFRISGPFTTFGSRALSILPICLAISVLPQPGGPNSKMPFTCLQPGTQKEGRDDQRQRKEIEVRREQEKSTNLGWLRFAYPN